MCSQYVENNDIESIFEGNETYGAMPSFGQSDSIEIGIFLILKRAPPFCIVLTYGDTNMASTLTSENIFFAVSRACSWPNGLNGGSIVKPLQLSIFSFQSLFAKSYLSPC